MKCPKCNTENPSDSKYCSECGTQLLPAEEISVSHTKTLETPKEELTTGSIFAGRYQIIEELGKGGMGKVYKVLDKKIKEKVALKLLRHEIASDKKTIERFSNELKFTRKIRHENVCQMYDLNELEGTHYITMEYVPGENLKSMIRMSRQLSLGTAVTIAKQVCAGLAEAHKLGVIHRDLKPQNIMIDRDGNARIMDFGIARSLKTRGITRAGVMIGTPEYMSPEQVEGKEADQRSDIYSLGVILYEMVTGRAPFEGETPLSIAVKHKTEEPRDPSQFNAQVPSDLSRMILRCMEKDKDKRYQGAKEVLSELSKIEEGIPTMDRVIPKRKAAAVPLRDRIQSFKIPGILLLVAILIVVGYLFFGRVLQKEKPEAEAISAIERKMIVVLPFENLGSPDDEYFADGISDEIMARLAGISPLGVIGRTSAIQYKKTEKTIQEIGEELGVDYVLEGTVRWQRSPKGPSRVRITPQLVRVSDATHVWAQVYDEDITDIFEVQSSIAEQVAEALDITLLESERRALEARPTDNLEAYYYYLRGKDYSKRGFNRKDIRVAIQMFEKAVDLDPTFAMAYTWLSYSHSRMYGSWDRTKERLDKAKQTADKAFQLRPELPESHWAMGSYYKVQYDWDRALKYFRIAQKSMQDDSELLIAISNIQWNQGKYEESIATLKKAFELDPRSTLLALNIAGTYKSMRNYPEAERYYDLAISLAPDLWRSYSQKARMYLMWEGSTEKARKVYEVVPKFVSSPGRPIFPPLSAVRLDVYDGNYQEALDRLSSLSREAFDLPWLFAPIDQVRAQIYRLMNQLGLAKSFYESARRLVEARIQEQPDDACFHGSLGIVYAGLGQKKEAIQEGKLAVELSAGSVLRLEELAQIYTMVGEHELAIDQLEYLLSIPGELSIPLLRIDPKWDPLREHPRFQRLMEEGK